MNFLDHATANPNRHRRSTSLADRAIVFISRIRFQLLAAMLVGVVAPIILRGNFERFPDQVANYDNSLYGTLSAVIFGYLIFRKVSSLPGATAFMNIVPSFLTSYGLVVAVFFALRLQYSRYQFIVSFLLVVGFFYALMFVLSHFRRSRFALMTDRKLADVPRLPRIEWVTTPTPELASERRYLPLVVDLHSPQIKEETQRYIAEEAIGGRLVYDIDDLKESLLGRVEIDRLAQSTFGHLAPDSIYGPAKRYLDALMAAIFLVVLSPLLLVVAVLIRLDSKGPAIFKQSRMGFRGQPFTVYKFRSMRVIDESQRTKSTDMTLSDDDRITTIGHFIRRTRIDELPQIFNILRGEMSWIGPRPETISLSEWYEKEIPFYRYRHMIRPGITGWAQVKQGHVTSVDDVRAKLEYDFYYVKNFSLWMDILIAIKTVGVMISGHGSK